MKTIIEAKFKGAHVKAHITKSLQTANGTVFLDQRFYAVFFYLILKIFKEYNKMKQWDGNKYWAACHQLVPMVILLLIKNNPIVFQCVWAITDFVHMVQYKSHTNKTLHYIKHALYWINQTKEVFWKACQIDAIVRAGKNKYFNFLKWYNILHYLKWIKYYGSAMGFMTGIEETMHITWIKNIFKQTNMRKSYKRQILDHNVEKFSLIVSDDIDLFLFIKILI